MKAIRLRTEYLFDPIGIDIQEPRLMWNCECGLKQTAYQIIAENWDSGRVESDSMPVVYPKELKSRERVTWRVRLWDENGESGDWAEGFFEMGLLTTSDWHAKWITGDYRPKKYTRCPVDCFKKEFSAKGEIVKARLYATARGIYDVTVNGHRLENFILVPGITDTDENLRGLSRLAGSSPVELLEYNPLAGAKYEGVGRKYSLGKGRSRSAEEAAAVFEEPVIRR